MAPFIGEHRGWIAAPLATPGYCDGDERRQREGEKATQLTRGLWANGDEYRIKRKAMTIVQSALWRWPDRARARCGELRRR